MAKEQSSQDHKKRRGRSRSPSYSSSSYSSSRSISTNGNASPRRKRRHKSSSNRSRSRGGAEEREREKNRQAVESRPRQWQVASDDDNDNNNNNNNNDEREQQQAGNDESNKDDTKQRRRRRRHDRKESSSKRKKKSSRRRSRSSSRSDYDDDDDDSSSSSSSNSGRSYHSRERHSRRSRHRHKHRRKEHKKHHKNSSSGRSSSDRKHSKKDSRKHRTTDPKSSLPGSASQDQFGKYGILRESDLHSKKRSFEVWLAEVKQLPSFTGSQRELKEYFKEYVEDFNTATMPHVKYYDYDRWEMEEYRRHQATITAQGGAASDEAAHLASLHRKKEEKKRLELELVRGTMNKDKIDEMKRQAQLKQEMAVAFKTGDEATKKKLQKRLEPEEKKVGGSAHPWAK